MIASRPASLRFTLVGAAVLLSMLAQFFLQHGDLHWSLAPLAVAVVCMTLDAISARRNDDLTARLSAHPPERTWRIRGITFTQLDIGWTFIIIANILMSFSLRNFGMDNLSVAWYSFGAAVTLLVISIVVMDGRLTATLGQAVSEGEVRVRLRTLAPWLILGAILLVAAAVRLYNLEEVPAGFWHDEAHTLAIARGYATDPGSIPVYEPSAHRPSLFIMIVAALVKLAGISVTVPRIVAALFGLMGIVVIFLLARHILGEAGGLIAAFLAAFMRWDINFSRIAFDATAGVMFAALTGWMTFRATRTGKHSDYALAGVCLGLGTWFYIANQLFFIVAGFTLLHHLIVGRPPLRRFIMSAAIMMLVALFVTAPLVQFAINDPDTFFERSRQVSLFSITHREEWASQIVDGLRKHILMFNREGDPNPRHNLPHAPMLDYFTGAMLALGFLFALTQWRNTALFALPVWALLMVLPGVLTVPWEAPQALRSILVLPAAAVLAACPLARLWSVSRRGLGPLTRRCAPPVFIGILTVIAYLNVDFYFGKQASDPRVYAEFSTHKLLISQSETYQQKRGHSIWVSRQFQHSLTSELLGSGPMRRIIRPPSTLPLDSTQVWNGASVYFEPRERGYWELARTYYPDGQFGTAIPPGGGDAMFYTAFLTREQVAARQGLDVEYSIWHQPVGQASQTLREAEWHSADGPGEYPYDLTITGALKVDVPGEYEIQIDSGMEMYVELNGRPVLSSEKQWARILPAVGMHSLRIFGRVDGPDNLVRLHWKPPGGEVEIIPYSHLYRGPVKPMGAAGRFYLGGDASGEPDAVEIIPSMDVFNYSPVIAEPHTVVWEGILEVETWGDHRFAVEQVSGPVRLYFEGELLAQDPPSEDVGREAEKLLSTGLYLLRVEYVAESHGRSTMFQILWQPPDEGMFPIPVNSLTPVREHILQVVE